MPLIRRLHLVLPLVLTFALVAEPASASAPDRSSGLRPVVQAKVELSLQLAAKRLEELDSCRALFQPFGRDGRDLLEAVRVVAAEHTPLAHACESGGVSLVTRMHGDTIGVCGNRLTRLPLHDTAARLLHEVLHHAGMGERPHEPGGLYPEQITRRVKRACRL